MSNSKLLSGDEVIRRLKRGETIWNAHIGTLKIRGDLCCGLFIRNSTIEVLDCSEARFTAAVELDGCRVIKRAYFKKSVFEQQSTFRRVQFEGGCDFSGAIFDKRTHFNLAVIVGWSTFEKAQFRCRTLFSKAHLKGEVVFRDCIFTTKSPVAEQSNKFSFNDMTCDFRVHMQGCRFDDNVTFTGTRFCDVADFEGAVFKRHARLKYAQFMRNVTFKSASFEGQMHLNGTTTECDLLFEETRFSGLINLQAMYGQRNVDFHKSIVGENSSFQIEKAHFSRLLIDRERIESHLESVRQNDPETARKEFGLLKHSFREINAYADEDWAYLMEKRMERYTIPMGRDKPLCSLKRFGNWLVLDLGCGYGTRPGNVFFTSLILLAFFAAVYYFSGGKFTGTVDGNGHVSMFEALELSFRIFTNAEVSSAEPARSSWLKYVMMAESSLGFFVMMVLVVTYSRKVIR
ncbi:MAG: pentapeptide repeat-containing protein [Planctomycetota bacterium]|nr:pentapeptide repeat-containing protein [Planctomycetota bacterium]